MIHRTTLGIGITLAVLTAAGVPVARAGSQTVTVKGYVLDSACAFTKNLKKPVSAECAVACAKAGSPLVILADDGTIYWPISDATPARGQNDRLLEFAGKRVSVTGAVYQRGGSRAMVIATVAESK
jgi:hypothetical protein